MTSDDTRPRHDGLAQLLHWMTTAALFLMLPFVWIAENFPVGPMRVFWYLLHEVRWNLHFPHDSCSSDLAFRAAPS